jgi:diguanylate cyclase (GGDEF)-like protein
VALLPDTDAEGALVLAEKVRRAVAEVDIPGNDRAVTASFGIAVFPHDAVDADTLFRSADRALYSAKSNGRNRVELVTREQAAVPDPA